MRDIDIIGITSDGQKIFAQVTLLPVERASDKIQALRRYGSGRGEHLILFCGGGEPSQQENILIFPIHRAYDVFTATPTGHVWLDVATPGLNNTGTKREADRDPRSAAGETEAGLGAEAQ
jgi:hypothetical protein